MAGLYCLNRERADISKREVMIQKEKGYLYFIPNQGSAAMRTKVLRGLKKVKLEVKMEPGYDSFIDDKGHLGIIKIDAEEQESAEGRAQKAA